MNDGYIKLYRKLSEKGWYKDSECVHLWLHLLMKANHKGSEFMLGYKIIKLKSGQLVTGRKALSAETGISESKVERILNMFENEKQIEQQTNSRNRVITILSWECYQQSEQQADSRRTTSEQQADTNNNDKKEKNVKNEKKEIRLPFSTDGFVSAWEMLLRQPKWKKKSQDALVLSLKMFDGLSELHSIAIIEKTIKNGWQGLFPLKPEELEEINKIETAKKIKLRDDSF